MVNYVPRCIFLNNFRIASNLELGVKGVLLCCTSDGLAFGSCILVLPFLFNFMTRICMSTRRCTPISACIPICLGADGTHYNL